MAERSEAKRNIEDGSTGDDACDSFRNYETDVKNVAALGLDFYRFSISWSRLIPTGVISEGISEAGLDYYHKLLNKLEEEKIEAMVTLYHWDLPQKLQDYGGWTNVSLAERFQEYADLCFKSFGPKVKRWITFNEPRENLLRWIRNWVHGAWLQAPRNRNLQYLLHNSTGACSGVPAVRRTLPQLAIRRSRHHAQLRLGSASRQLCSKSRRGGQIPTMVHWHLGASDSARRLSVCHQRNCKNEDKRERIPQKSPPGVQSG
ncbi:unnamed protein product [Oikopleura dioica]|uniref:Uncharacterized protein n=1 Tax=Oikopleura dioica TaxID=34765 RepID=E4XTD7_OIKDI|nr:unnamed protein product [Oikopleura dioica]